MFQPASVISGSVLLIARSSGSRDGRGGGGLWQRERRDRSDNVSTVVHRANESMHAVVRHQTTVLRLQTVDATLKTATVTESTQPCASIDAACCCGAMRFCMLVFHLLFFVLSLLMAELLHSLVSFSCCTSASPFLASLSSALSSFLCWSSPSHSHSSSSLRMAIKKD